ncbi:pathogenesis-related BetVI family protein, partial [Xanthomonas sacchari]|uniref:pathogenesis-related BetVI family protein n=1 Tax=Xanthomonas sacchari TaxID=56458 RepID=UPI00224C83B8
SKQAISNFFSILTNTSTSTYNLFINIIMGVLTFEDETVSVVAPARLYKALVKDADTLIPKVIDPIQSVEIVEGNGGPGTIKKLTFTEGGQTGHVLHQVDAIDEANFGYNYSVVGGAGLPVTVEK